MACKICQMTVILLVILTNSTCSDGTENNNIPLVAVDFVVQLNDPDFIKLKTIGEWVYVTGGSRGIILYRLDANTIKAYDRHCTFQPSNSCALVSVDPAGTSATDDCCGSTFLLLNGSVARPPASIPLKQYNTSLDASQTTLRIFN
mgnify:CR=1 FL=1